MTDAYVVIHIATTCDEHGVYVSKDSAEVIEMAWLLLDAKTLEETYHSSILVRPVNTPITALCTSLTTLTWENVRNAGSFRDAINRFDTFAQEHLIQKGLDFTFVTFNAWDLRVQLPREARDKAVILPPYLQHSRTFDLRTEYIRWQNHHPESLPFSASNLSNICAALEVEPVQASAPIKHNLPFHLQALAPASPRRAMDEAITLSRVLKGLIKKAQPIEEHVNVLTKPLDARSDVRCFLSERSKILHLSNLPHDTTQSELESWFTQYGGRPIAFWTLRTPDQHKPTGTGFAVFSSHEEAAESLAMNGRALNEKAIEVSPSSSRVLDRAQDILTPFPPSKNRPRPGDWTCPSCGFSNFQRRTACFRCSFPAASIPPGHEQVMMYGYGQHVMNGASSVPGALSGGPTGSGRSHSYGAVPFRAGDWKCGTEGCGYHNFAKNVSCLRCGASRSVAALVSEPLFSTHAVSGHTTLNPQVHETSLGINNYNAGNSGNYNPNDFQGQLNNNHPTAQSANHTNSSYSNGQYLGPANSSNGAYQFMGQQFSMNTQRGSPSHAIDQQDSFFGGGSSYMTNRNTSDVASKNDPYSMISGIRDLNLTSEPQNDIVASDGRKFDNGERLNEAGKQPVSSGRVMPLKAFHSGLLDLHNTNNGVRQSNERTVSPHFESEARMLNRNNSSDQVRT